MIVLIRIIIFILIVVFIKLLFVYINEIEFKKIEYMKELIDFTVFLRIFSCDMRMNLSDILNKYSFKESIVKKACMNLSKNIELTNNNDLENEDFCKFLSRELQTPEDFNIVFNSIADFYGNTTSDILKKKLLYVEDKMVRITNDFENNAKERKVFFNKISILLGILIAILLIWGEYGYWYNLKSWCNRFNSSCV